MNSSPEILKGTPVKIKNKKFGIIDEALYHFANQRDYYCYTHNGMKVVSNIVNENDIEVIDTKRFLAYVKRSGKNSLLSFLNH